MSCQTHDSHHDRGRSVGRCVQYVYLRQNAVMAVAHRPWAPPTMLRLKRALSGLSPAYVHAKGRVKSTLGERWHTMTHHVHRHMQGCMLPEAITCRCRRLLGWCLLWCGLLRSGLLDNLLWRDLLGATKHGWRGRGAGGRGDNRSGGHGESSGEGDERSDEEDEVRTRRRAMI